MKIFYTTEIPFWTRDTDNRPSPALLKYFEENELIEDTGNLIRVNYLNYNSVKVVSKINNLKYIKVVLDNNEVYYYYIDNIDKILANGGYVFDALLDIWCTLCIKFINDNRWIELPLLRHKEFNFKTFHFEDDLLNNIPKRYLSSQFVEIKYPQSNWYYTNSTEIRGKYFYGNKNAVRVLTENLNDITAGNLYFIVSDGKMGGFTFIPVLMKGNNTLEVANSSILNPDNYEIIEEKTYRYFKINKPGMLGYDIAPTDIEIREINAWLREIDSNENEFCRVLGTSNFTNGNKNPTYNYVISDTLDKSTNITDIYATGNVDLDSFISDYNYFFARWKYRCNGKDSAEWKTDAFSEQFQEQYKAYNQIEAVSWIKLQRCRKKSNITNNVSFKEVNNSFNYLIEILKTEEYANKIMGLFICPNFLDFNIDLSINSKYNFCYFNFNNNYDNRRVFKSKILDFDNIQNYDGWAVDFQWDTIWNNSLPSIYCLKYIVVNYLNNILPIYYYYIYNNITIIGYPFFTKNFTLICNPNQEILRTYKSGIIEYSYQLPLNIDKYNQYIQANINSTNTSYNNFKSLINIQKEGLIFNSVLAGIGTILNMPLGGIGTQLNNALEISSGVGNTIINNKEINQQLKNKENEIRAAYHKANITMGNEVLSSDIESILSYVYYEFNATEYSTGVFISMLSADTVIQINNMLYLYGFYYPNINSLSNILADIESDKYIRQQRFYYVKVDKYILETQISIKNNFLNYQYDMIKTIFSNGIRIWAKTAYEYWKDNKSTSLSFLEWAYEK